MTCKRRMICIILFLKQRKDKNDRKEEWRRRKKTFFDIFTTVDTIRVITRHKMHATLKIYIHTIETTVEETTSPLPCVRPVLAF